MAISDWRKQYAMFNTQDTETSSSVDEWRKKYTGTSDKISSIPENTSQKTKNLMASLIDTDRPEQQVLPSQQRKSSGASGSWESKESRITNLINKTPFGMVANSQLVQNINANPIVKNTQAAISKAGAGAIKGLTLGGVDVEKGTEGIPFVQNILPQTKINFPGKMDAASLERLGISPKVAENQIPEYIGEFAGSTAPIGTISRGVSALGQGVKGLTAGTKLAEVELPNALQKAGKLGERLLHAGTVGGIFGITQADTVKDIPQSAAENALGGVLFQGAGEIAGAGIRKIKLKALQDLASSIKDWAYGSGKTVKEAENGATKTIKSFIDTNGGLEDTKLADIRKLDDIVKNNKPVQNVPDETAIPPEKISLPETKNIKETSGIKQEPVIKKESVPAFPQETKIKQMGFNDAGEAHLAFEARENGLTWFKNEFPEAPTSKYKELVNKLDSIPEQEQNQFKIDLQMFARNNPQQIQAAKDNLISRFRRNTIQMATAIPEDLKTDLLPNDFKYEPQTAKQWQANAEKNIAENRDKVMNDIREGISIANGTQAHEAAIIANQLKNEAIKTGDVSKFKDWMKTVAEKTRETARGLKGTDTAWDKTKSTEGAVLKAQKSVNNATSELEKADPKKNQRVKSDTDRVKRVLDDAQKEAAKKTAEEILANRIVNTAKVKKQVTPDPAKQMIDELFKVAKESPLPVNKTRPSDPITFLQDAIQNKEQYSTVWEKAKTIIKNKYGQDIEAMKKLNNYLEKGIIPTYSQATLNTNIALSMKELEQKLVDIAKSSKGDREKFLLDLREYLIGKVGATKENADLLSKQIGERFDALVKDKSKSLLKSVFKERDAPMKQNTLKSIEELANIGAFKDSTYISKIGDKLTPKVKQLLSESNIDLGALVKKLATDVDFNKNMFLLDLETKLKIDRQDAAVILKETEKIFDNLASQKKTSILKLMFAKKVAKSTTKSLTEKVLEAVNLGAYDDANIVNLMKEKEGFPILSNDDIKYIMDTMETAKNLPEGSYEQQVAVAKVKKLIVDKVPVTLGEKISTFQTIAQLLNPKTQIRNIGGNLVFGTAEKASDILGAGMDKLVSIYTGKRSKLAPDISIEAKGFFRGYKEAMQDFKHGIDTSPDLTKYDLPRKQVFKGKVLGTVERLNSLALKAGDRPFYQAAYDSALNEQKKIAGVKEPTKEMIDQARNVAEYRTFQDENAISNLFSGLKRLLNVGKAWGFGDMVLKYPKTPANILARAIDYSPAGYINSLNQLYKATQGEFSQRAFVDSLSRATVGTGMFLAGISLYNLGIVSGSSNTDKDVTSMEQATGQGQYRINLSALMRFGATFDPKAAQMRPGDKIMNYDWIQPLSISFSAGANTVKQLKEKSINKALDALGAVVAGLEGGGGTLSEQSMVKGISNLFKGYGGDNVVDNLINLAFSVPASFIPTLSNQIKQITDNVKRSTKSDNVVENGINQVKNKIPGLSTTLPARYNTLGEKQLTYQDNNLANVLLNPSYSSEYKINPAAKLVMDIYDRTGSKEHFPRVAPNYVTYNGKKVKLSPELQGKLQQIMGKMVTQKYTELAKNRYFMRFPDERKVATMESMLGAIGRRSRMEFMRNNFKELNEQYKEQTGKSLKKF